MDFWSRIQKYCIFIACDWCFFIVSLAILSDAVLSVHTFEIGCWWTIYFNVFRTMIISLLVTKHPLVSASAVEAAK